MYPGVGRFGWLVLLALLAVAAGSEAQTAKAPSAESPYYSRANTFGVLAAYSNDSSHILLGESENRKLLEFGAMYSRRLVRSHAGILQYNFEFLPLAMESDPVENFAISYTSPIVSSGESSSVPIVRCVSGSGSFDQTINGVTFAGTYSNTCSRQWTVGQAMSPIGLQWNFRPRRRLQPFIVGHGGYMYSTRSIPVAQAGSFNFTFDFGAGLELFQSKAQSRGRLGLQSVRLEYRYHHISNDYTATYNPGIDNGLFQLTWAFGR